ncbi:SDR family oxidoreductase [Streptomyces sp. NPDC048295]|uniref:SDR family oxidoreductase n=1 Tax=Streptomyces sp. NPDC048295 TaxID=3154617 RepID=UPI00344AADD7
MPRPALLSGGMGEHKRPGLRQHAGGLRTLSRFSVVRQVIARSARGCSLHRPAGDRASAPGGTFVVIGSTVSVQPPAGMGLYGGIKAAVRAFSRSWIQDIKGTGIRINVLGPGAVDTESLCGALGMARARTPSPTRSGRWAREPHRADR